MTSTVCWRCDAWLDPNSGRPPCVQCEIEGNNRDVATRHTAVLWPSQAPEDIMDYERESRYRVLHHALESRELSTVYPFYFIDSQKPHGRSSTINGRAQTAHCLYCNKAVLQLKKAPPGKRRAPPELSTIQNSHTYPCAERWWWQTMCRWAAKSFGPVEEARVWAWVQKLEQAAREYGGERRDHRLHDPWHPTRIDDAIAKQLEALPMPVSDPRIVELEVNFSHAVATVFTPDRPPWEPFVHGDDRAHPHVYIATTFERIAKIKNRDAEALAGLPDQSAEWGLCPCGQVGPPNITWSTEEGIDTGVKIQKYLADKERRP